MMQSSLGIKPINYKLKNVNGSFTHIFNSVFDRTPAKHISNTHMPLKRRLYASV